MKLELLTDRLELSPLTLAYTELAVEMFTDPQVTRFAGGGVCEEDIRKGMPVWIKRGADGCIGIWSIADRNSGEQYGDCFLLPIPVEKEDTNWDDVIAGVMPEGDIEVGVYLKKSAWGQGIATDACRRLLEFAFEKTSLQEIVATADDDNLHARHILERIGFVCQGRRLAYGKDSPDYRLERRTWIALTSAAHA